MKFLTNKSKLLFLVLSILSTPFAYAQEKGLDERINDAFTPIANWWESLILHNFPGTEIPTIIFLLVGGALFLQFILGSSTSKDFQLQSILLEGNMMQLRIVLMTEKSLISRH